MVTQTSENRTTLDSKEVIQTIKNFKNQTALILRIHNKYNKVRGH